MIRNVIVTGRYRPSLPSGVNWIARALLEAPDVGGRPGEFEVIEAEVGSNLTGSFTTEHAQHQNGWYMVQWHSNNHTNVFTEPSQARSAGSPVEVEFAS